MIDMNQLYQRNENFVFRRIEDETILVPIKDNVGDMGSIYNLNEVGALVWEQLDGRQTLGEIGDKIADAMEMSVQATKSLLCRARENLRDLLEPYMQDGISPGEAADD